MKNTVYLIIHGFGGNTDEIQYLADYLVSKQLNVHTPLLAGHGSDKKALSRSSYKDWILSIENTLENLDNEYSEIICIGFSMGGLIGFNSLAHPKITRIITINTPIHFWNLKVIISDIFSGIFHKNYDKIKYYKDSLFGSSVKSGIDFLKILYKTKKYVGAVKKPILIIQCKNDESVRYKSAYYIKDKFGDYADLRLYNGGCHQIFKKSPELRDLICKDIYLYENSFHK